MAISGSGASFKIKQDDNTYESLEGVISINGPEISANTIEVTSLSSENQEFIRGIPGIATVTVECYWTNATQQQFLNTALADGTSFYFRIEQSDSSGFDLYGTVDSFSLNTEANAAVTATFSFTATTYTSFAAVSVTALLIGDSYMADGGFDFYVWPTYSETIAVAQIDAVSAYPGKYLISAGTNPVLPNIAAILAAHDAPTVCLGIGANDIINGATLNDMQRAMMSVINAIVADGRKLIISGMAPIGSATGVSAAELIIIKAYHAWLESICTEYGFEFVDFYDYLEGSTPDEYDPAKDNELIGGGGDLLHPNAASALYIAQMWDEAIRRSAAAPLVTSVPTYYQQYFSTAASTRLSGNIVPTGHATDGRATLSMWVKPDAVASIQRLFNGSFSGSDILDVRLTESATVSATHSTGTLLIAGGSLVAGQKTHILLSVAHDTDQSYLYINDTYINQDIALTAVNYAAITLDWAFLGKVGVSEGLAGSFSDIWYDDQFIDISVEANRRDFILADGTPADVFGTTGTDGTIGTVPLFYFGTRNTLTELNAATANNLGSAQNLTKSGTDFALVF